jgi:hypothetical protein
MYQYVFNFNVSPLFGLSKQMYNIGNRLTKICERLWHAVQGSYHTVRNINVHKDVVSLCGNGGILKQCPVKTEIDR